MEFDFGRRSIAWMKREAVTLGVRHGAEMRHFNLANAGQGHEIDSVPELLAMLHEREHGHLLRKAIAADTTDFFYSGYNRGEALGKAGLPNPYGITSVVRTEPSPPIVVEARKL